LNSAPHDSILLLEDIDAVFVGRTSNFSGILNAIDGLMGQEGET
jgi:hypothetical protein